MAIEEETEVPTVRVFLRGRSCFGGQRVDIPVATQDVSYDPQKNTLTIRIARSAIQSSQEAADRRFGRMELT